MSRTVNRCKMLKLMVRAYVRAVSLELRHDREEQAGGGATGLLVHLDMEVCHRLALVLEVVRLCMSSFLTDMGRKGAIAATAASRGDSRS